MKGKHSLRLLAIYSLNEQNQRTKARSRRGKRTGVFYWLWRERKSITPWKRFELHCDYTFNAEYFVIHEVPVFIVRSPPCWRNFYVYLSPISIFFRPLAFKYKSYLPVMFREDLSSFTESQWPVCIVLHLHWTVTQSQTLQIKLREAVKYVQFIFISRNQRL